MWRDIQYEKSILYIGTAWSTFEGRLMAFLRHRSGDSLQRQSRSLHGVNRVMQHHSISYWYNSLDSIATQISPCCIVSQKEQKASVLKSISMYIIHISEIVLHLYCWQLHILRFRRGWCWSCHLLGLRVSRRDLGLLKNRRCTWKKMTNTQKQSKTCAKKVRGEETRRNTKPTQAPIWFKCKGNLPWSASASGSKASSWTRCIGSQMSKTLRIMGTTWLTLVWPLEVNRALVHGKIVSQA